MTNVLKIDLDGKVTPCRWAKWCTRAVQALSLAGFYAERVIDVRRSPSGGVHVRIPVDGGESELTSLEIVALQAILGSDPKREALNLARARAGIDANVLHTRRDGAEWGTPWPAGVRTWLEARRTAGLEGPGGWDA